MDSTLLCQRCNVLRQQVVSVQCCGSQVCLDCLRAIDVCPGCNSQILKRQPSIDMRPPQTNHTTLFMVRCPYLGCEEQTIDVLLPKHMSSCPHAPPPVLEVPVDMPVLVQAIPHASDTDTQLAVRANVFKEFVGFDNVARALKMAGHTAAAPPSKPVLSEDGYVPAPGASVTERLHEMQVHEVKHMVTSVDTLEGLALAYGCEVEDIRRRNSLRGPLYCRLFVVIPATKTPRPQTIEDLERMLKSKLEARLQTECGGASKDEAVFYLESALYDYARAVAAFKEDSRWDSENTNPAPTVAVTSSEEDGCIRNVLSHLFSV